MDEQKTERRNGQPLKIYLIKSTPVFNFDLDVCALPENAKCSRFFTPNDDGLKQESTGTCWMNPPYGREIIDWISKADYTAQQGHTVLALVPVRTDARWFQDYCLGEKYIL